MYKATLKEIIKAPDLKSDKFDIFDIFSHKDFNVEVSWNEKDLKNISLHTKIDVDYDGRRGARLDVLKYFNRPFLIVSRAGIDLMDTFTYKILDTDLLNKARLDISGIMEFKEESSLEEDLEFCYWEGSPVNLGDNYYGIKN